MPGDVEARSTATASTVQQRRHSPGPAPEPRLGVWGATRRCLPLWSGRGGRTAAVASRLTARSGGWACCCCWPLLYWDCSQRGTIPLPTERGGGSPARSAPLSGKRRSHRRVTTEPKQAQCAWGARQTLRDQSRSLDLRSLSYGELRGAMGQA